MLGVEPEIVANYVAAGTVKLIFWPVLNHGNPSLYATITAHCVGQQDPALFWAVHEKLFANQSDLWGADRDYYVATAVAIGADQAAFAACYDSPDSLTQVLELDDLRRQAGVFSQPVFDINGQLLYGSQPFAAFAQVIQTVSP